MLSKLMIQVAILLPLAKAYPFLNSTNSSIPTYDVIIVGGGPAGLSAASALGRVRRCALLIDSAEYRNAPTLEMHDVIGNDGTKPAAFRALAREQIAVYPSVTMMNGSVSSIESVNNGSSFIAILAGGEQYFSRKVILAIGMKDTLPDTPGLAAVWGKGMYWCPWCDGWEHRDKPFAKLGAFSASFVKGAIRATSLNSNIILLTNGTFDDSAVAEIAETLPDWQERLALSDIGIENRQIAGFSRLRGLENDVEDDILVNFTSGGSITRNAINAVWPARLASDLPIQLNLNLTDQGSDLYVSVDGHMESSFPGVFAVGDANSDESQNVPHAMWSAKRSVVYMHGVLASEYATVSLEGSHQHGKRRAEVELESSLLKKGLAAPFEKGESVDDWLTYMLK